MRCAQSLCLQITLKLLLESVRVLISWKGFFFFFLLFFLLLPLIADRKLPWVRNVQPSTEQLQPLHSQV